MVQASCASRRHQSSSPQSSNWFLTARLPRCLASPAAHSPRQRRRGDRIKLQCLLSRSLLGVKRTCVAALHESAFDPKRTLADLHVRRFQCASLSRHDALVLSLGGGNETARVHYTSQRCGCVATHSACATVGKAADYWVPGRRHNVLASMDGCLYGAAA